MSSAQPSPFAPRTVLLLLIFGAGVFVLLLWMLGTGIGSGNANDGGAHVGGRGLNGYAALAELLERRGYSVQRSRTEAALDDETLLILTPPLGTDPAKLDKIITNRRTAGPTLVILPKWQAMQIPPGAKVKQKTAKGWVVLLGPTKVDWSERAESLGSPHLMHDPVEGSNRTFAGLGHSALKPPGAILQSMDSRSMAALVRSGAGDMLAGYVGDGDYPYIAEASGNPSGDGEEESKYPITVVAEPDLLNNYGLADRDRAMLALDLVDAATDGYDLPVSFDLTLPGHGRSTNLLTLAFTPPFVAATLCLLLAALVVAWRAFVRFGGALAVTREIAFGKRALVSNAAGLLQRAGRLHLLGAPYADAARERLARALALPGHRDPAVTEQAIDRALAARAPQARPFSAAAAAMRAARRPHDLLRAAQDLHMLERILRR